MTVWRALLIAVLPSFGLWLFARDNPQARGPVRQFTRQPSPFDCLLLALGGGVLAGGLLAGSPTAEILGAAYSVAGAYRLALRFFAPTGWFRTDMEFWAAANVRSLTRVALCALLIWTIANQRWTGTVILSSCLAGLVVAETLVALAAGHFIRRRNQVAKP